MFKCLHTRSEIWLKFAGYIYIYTHTCTCIFIFRCIAAKNIKQLYKYYINIPSIKTTSISSWQELQAPSVAAELLVSSALRMLWPADARCLYHCTWWLINKRNQQVTYCHHQNQKTCWVLAQYHPSLSIVTCGDNHKWWGMFMCLIFFKCAQCAVCQFWVVRVFLPHTHTQIYIYIYIMFCVSPGLTWSTSPVAPH